MTDLAARGAIQALQREHQTLKNRLSAAERRIGELEARTGDEAPTAQDSRLAALERVVGAIRADMSLNQVPATNGNAVAEGDPVQEEVWPRKHGKHGPFYQLSDGRKVRGKEAAETAQAEIDNQNASAETAG